MKKIALLLSCFICLGMLTACGGGSEKIPPAAGADPFGYIEQGVLGMEEGQAAALDENLIRDEGEPGEGIIYYKSVDWEKIRYEVSLNVASGRIEKIFYSIHVDIDQKEQATDKIKELISDCEKRYGAVAESILVPASGEHLPITGSMEEEILRFCDNTDPQEIVLQWPLGTQGAHGELFSTMVISNREFDGAEGFWISYLIAAAQ